MQRHGWMLLFHDCIVGQLQKLHAAAERAQRNDPQGYEGNANVKLFRVLGQLIHEVVPSDPGREEYRQGNTLGPAHRHWRRAKVGRRFRLFFRYDSRSKIIVFAWVNDEQMLRSSGSKSDPYVVFKKMLQRGHPPDDWKNLVAASRLQNCARIRVGASTRRSVCCLRVPRPKSTAVQQELLRRTCSHCYNKDALMPDIETY